MRRERSCAPTRARIRRGAPDPAVDSAAYEQLCRQTPNAPDCNLPLYWPAPQMVVSTKAGMHRVMWDLKYEPLAEGGGRGGAAVPRHTYPTTNAPWAAPGNYTVRLTAGGKTYTQPLALHLDPRVKTTAPGLTQLTALTKEMYAGAKTAHAAAEQGRALAASLDTLQGPDIAAFKAQVVALAPPAPLGGGRGGFGGRGGGRGRGGAPAAQTLDTVSGAMMSAAMAMQAADVAPTAREVAASAEARRESTAVMAKWTQLTTVDLPALNAKRKAAGQPPIPWPPK